MRFARDAAFALTLTLFTPGLAAAGPFGSKTDESGGCSELKPEQRLSEDRQKELDSAISLGLKGLGQGSGSIDKSSASSVQIQVLKDDALAKSWFIYQVCVMKKAEVIDETTAQELVRSLMGLEPTQVTITTTPAVPAPVSPAAGPADAVLRISGPDGDVDVHLDGHSVGAVSTGLSVPTVAGTHEIEARRKGFKPFEADLDVPAQGLDYRLPELKKRKKTGLWVGIGLGVAAVGGGVAAGVAAANAAAPLPPANSTSCFTTPTYGYYYTCY